MDKMKRNLKATFVYKLIFNLSNLPKNLFAVKLLLKYQFGKPHASAPAKIPIPKNFPHNNPTATAEITAKPRFRIITLSIKLSVIVFKKSSHNLSGNLLIALS